MTTAVSTKAYKAYDKLIKWLVIAALMLGSTQIMFDCVNQDLKPMPPDYAKRLHDEVMKEVEKLNKEQDNK